MREILQEVALSGLARAGFFKHGAFHGGSCLRIVHGLRRFSEDLDFVLKDPTPDFSWSRYAKALTEELRLYGVDLEIRDRGSSRAVKALFLKDRSLGKLLDLQHPLHPGKKLVVKLEVDTNPPAGSAFETRYVDFPVPFALLAQDLPSNFAGKLHALLCRGHVKGRDWFDLTWYLRGGVHPHLPLLESALDQQGPWQGQKPRIDTRWLVRELERKIATIDFDLARSDVERFLQAPERRGLQVWGNPFFLSQVQKLAVARRRS